MNEHVSEQVLAERLEGALTPTVEAKVASHLLQCAHCLRIDRELRQNDRAISGPEQPPRLTGLPRPPRRRARETLMILAGAVLTVVLAAVAGVTLGQVREDRAARVLASPSAPATSARAALPTSRIVLLDRPNMKLVVTNAAGDDLGGIATGGEVRGTPVVHPQTAQVAYWRISGGVPQLVVWRIGDADVRTVATLGDLGPDGAFMWSPDGGRIVALVSRTAQPVTPTGPPAEARLLLVDVGAGQARALANYRAEHPARPIAFDGSRIAALRSTGGQGTRYVIMDAQSGEETASWSALSFDQAGGGPDRSIVWGLVDPFESLAAERLRVWVFSDYDRQVAHLEFAGLSGVAPWPGRSAVVVGEIHRTGAVFGLRILDLASGFERPAVRFDEPVTPIAFDPTGELLLVKRDLGGYALVISTNGQLASSLRELRFRVSGLSDATVAVGWAAGRP